MHPHKWHSFSPSTSKNSNSNVCVLFQCTGNKCRRFFVNEYGIGIHTQDGYYEEYLAGPAIPYPQTPTPKPDFPEEIAKVSSMFVQIYTQAMSAEAFGLDQIAGIGYRKALEFLIKDYASHKSPEKADEIKKKFLGDVINSYIDFNKIKDLATAATWIGNDETHYIRRHEDKDIQDMKRFIRSATLFIAADYDADEAKVLTAQK
ncbi:DUF4145 domain-containing protein [Listeria booriae]|nr:DUF4145 domain-containing protein [Listeria booriae]